MYFRFNISYILYQGFQNKFQVYDMILCLISRVLKQVSSIGYVLIKRVKHSCTKRVSSTLKANEYLERIIDIVEGVTMFFQKKTCDLISTKV